MKRKPIIYITSILLLIGCYLFFKTNDKKKPKVAGFKVEAISYEIYNDIVFSDTTYTSKTWKWNFGDSTSSSSHHTVSHFYKNAGEYKVKLQTDKYVLEKLIYIMPFKDIYEQMADFDYTPKEINAGTLVSFKDLTKNAKSWEWKFGESKDTTVIDSEERNPTYTYKESGLKKITLVVNNDYNHSQTSHTLVWPKGIKYGQVCGGLGFGPELKKLDENLLKRALMGISQNELSFRNFTKYFCKSNMPVVHLSDQSKISLRELEESIRGTPIKINKAKLKKDKDGCITHLYIDYQLLK